MQLWRSLYASRCRRLRLDRKGILLDLRAVAVAVADAVALLMRPALTMTCSEPISHYAALPVLLIVFLQ